MMHSLRLTPIALVAVLVLGLAAPAHGIQIADYLGYAWLSAGFPPTVAGEQFTFVGAADAVDPLAGVNLANEEVTFYISGLEFSFASVNDPAPGWTTYYFTGGMLDMYRDAAMNAETGINPPNGTAPSTFIDGVLMLHASFTSFGMTVDPTGAGSYGGAADGISGELITACAGCIFTWGGSFTADIGAQVPEGYDLQLDGILDIDPTVPVEDQKAWGMLKATFDTNR
jgi:hypothetical protein